MLKAAGVKYEPGWPAPLLLLKSRGAAAERVVKSALKLGIPVRKEELLGEALMVLPEGSFIPETYFEIIATVLSAVYNGNQNHEKRKR